MICHYCKIHVDNSATQCPECGREMKYEAPEGGQVMSQEAPHMPHKIPIEPGAQKISLGKNFPAELQQSLILNSDESFVFLYKSYLLSRSHLHNKVGNEQNRSFSINKIDLDQRTPSMHFGYMILTNQRIVYLKKTGDQQYDTKVDIPYESITSISPGPKNHMQIGIRWEVDGVVAGASFSVQPGSAPNSKRTLLHNTTLIALGQQLESLMQKRVQEPGVGQGKYKFGNTFNINVIKIRESRRQSIFIMSAGIMLLAVSSGFPYLSLLIILIGVGLLISSFIRMRKYKKP